MRSLPITLQSNFLMINKAAKGHGEKRTVDEKESFASCLRLIEATVAF